MQTPSLFRILPFANRQSLLRIVALAVAIFPAISSHANVYATNIRLNGGTNNVSVGSGGSVSVGYLLNEPATVGVTVDIKSGNTTVRTITLAGGGAGTARGTNSVVWNGKDNLGNNVAGGTYSVVVTAAAIGYGDWTQISYDTNAGNYVYEPRGIAVNRNTNSFYYGRVFVGNAFPGPNPEATPGDGVGIQKLNADGSAAAEGIFSTGGWPWAGNDYSPWKIEVSDDDFVYVNDWASHGVVLRFDQKVSTNSRTLVLRNDNWPNGGAANLSGPFITGGGTNTKVWMADINYPTSTGVRRWNVDGTGTIATNDLGTTIVQAGGGSDLSLYPYDVAVDHSNRIYTIQFRDNNGDPAYRVMRFPAYDELGTPETLSDWKIGSGDDNLRDAFGIAVDPTETYVAVVFAGVGAGGDARLFSVTNGTNIVTIPLAGFHDHRDVAWDNVGNLYLCDNWDSTWRTFSPPGTNQATTVAVAVVQTLQPLPPTLSAPSYTNGQFQFTLNGQADTTYLIQASTNLTDWTPALTNSQSPATRLIVLSAPADRNFYRAVAP